MGRVIRDLSGMVTPDVLLVTCAPMDHTHVMRMHSAPKLVLDDSSARYREIRFTPQTAASVFFLLSVTPGCDLKDKQCTPLQIYQ